MLRSPIVNDLTRRIVNLAAKSRLPAIYDDQRFAQLGGLMSYGVNLADLDRSAAAYIDKILKGVKPANLRMNHPTNFERDQSQDRQDTREQNDRESARGL